MKTKKSNKVKKRMAVCLVFVGLLTGCGADNADTVDNQKTSEIMLDTAADIDNQQGEEMATEEFVDDKLEDKTDEVNNESKEEGSTTLTYIGHASIKIVAKDGTVVYVDPAYENGDYSDEADYMFITHDHSDHLPCGDVKLKNDGTKITHFEALHDGVYETFDYGNVKVEAVAAANNNHKIEECVGYLITVDGITIYHAGDTSMIDQMNGLSEKEIDYALYPIDGVYNMDAKEATEVANLVGAKNNIPIHELDQGDTKKSDNFTPNGKMVIGYGETIELK